MSFPVRPVLLSLLAVALIANAGALSNVGSLGDMLDAMDDSFWTYAVLGASSIVFEELAPIFGGIAVHDDVLRMDHVILALSLGGWIATTLLYWAGRAKWEFLRRKFPRLRAPGTIALGVVRRNPWRASLLVRFAFGARLFLPMACGAAHVRFPVYLIASLLGSVAWSIAFALLGYAAGEAAVRVMGHLGRAGEAAGAILVTALVIGLMRWQRARRIRKLAKQRQERSTNTPPSTPGVNQGKR